MVITLNFTTAPLHISASKDFPFPILSLPNDIEHLILAHYLKPWERRALSYVDKRFYYHLKDLKPLCTYGNCTKLLKSAAKIGSIAYLTWLSRDWKLSEKYYKVLAHNAVEAGQLNVLIWLKNQGFLFNCTPDDINLYDVAVKNDHLEVIKWLHTETSSRIFARNHANCGRAAKGGHFETLKWLYANDNPINSYTFELAAKGGIKKYLNGLKSKIAKWMWVLLGAQLKMVIWKSSNG